MTISRYSPLLERSTSDPENSLSREQLQLDQTLYSFSESVTDPASLASFAVGGFVGRAFRLGILSAGAKSVSPTLFRLSANVFSWGAEATAFETTHRSLQIAQGRANSNILRWGGNAGLGQGILNSFVNFATLKTVGHLAPANHLVLQHSVQSSAFVLAHHVAAKLGLQPEAQGSLVEQLAQAECTNLQMIFGMSLLHKALPGMNVMERNMDVLSEIATPSSRSIARGKGFRELLPAGNLTLENSIFRAMPDPVAPSVSGEPALIFKREISSENYELVRASAKRAEGGSLIIAPSTIHESEGYKPLIQLWHDLLPRAATYSDLRMELGGVRFRYGELPPEPVKNASLPPANETFISEMPVANRRMGTLIEVDNAHASFDEIHSVIKAYLAHGDPTWFARNTSRKIEDVRTVFPESMAAQLRMGTYDHYAQMRTWLHSVSSEIVRMSEDLSAGSALSEAQRLRLAELKKNEKNWMEEFLGFREAWQWMVSSRVRTREEVQEGPSIRQVIHDLNNRLSSLMTLGFEISLLETGHPISADLIQTLENSTHLTVASAVNEGISMALAMAEQAGIKTPTSFSFPTRFQNVLLTEDYHVEFAFMDVMGNLLSNAFRYSDPQKDLLNRKVSMTAHFIQEGGLEITVADNGIGILPGSLDRLGESGFREARKEVLGSSGHGIGSVIQILRERGWGPLWVRSEAGAGSHFRFVIPKSNFQLAENFVADPATDLDTLRPTDPLSYVERNIAEGFLVPAASMDVAIPQLLRQIPSSKDLLTDHHLWDQIIQGTNGLRRLEALHRLLSGAIRSENIRVVDNAYGSFPHLFLTMARMGSHVWLKEPNKDMDALQFVSVIGLPSELSERIHETHSVSIDHPLGARVSYWSNPNYGHFNLPQGEVLENYLGRDVEVGGYLVIQNGKGVFERTTRGMMFNPQRWQVIYQSPPETDSFGIDYVLPTASSSRPNALFVYRRIR